jgi:excinuclease UvrABC nuclease subunit
MTMQRLGRRIRFTDENISEIPEEPGIYVFWSRHGRCLRVGMTGDLRQRIREYRYNGRVPGAHTVQIRVTYDRDEALQLEPEYIKRYRPRLNVQLTGN